MQALVFFASIRVDGDDEFGGEVGGVAVIIGAAKRYGSRWQGIVITTF